MKFSGKSIRSLTKILKATGDAEKVRFTIDIRNIEKDKLLQLGFDEFPNIGDALIPSVIGKFTAFNVNGSIKIRKDLPKEPESIMFLGSSTDWHGGVHTGIRTRTIDKYPREYISAPSEILQIIEINKNIYISSCEILLNDSNESKNILITNIMLECFNEFEIFDVVKDKIVGPKLKNLQWNILPSGEYPWDKAKSIISRATEQLEDKDKKVIEYRMRIISRRNPDFLATGRAGFSGYFVYGFENNNIYVLESIHLDNATYVFNSDWESLSKLTKSEIINSNISHTRIIHNKKWSASIGKVIDGKEI